MPALSRRNLMFLLAGALRGSRKATNNTVKFEREVMIGFRAQTIWNCCSAIEVNLIIYVALVGSYVYYHG